MSNSNFRLSFHYTNTFFLIFLYYYCFISLLYIVLLLLLDPHVPHSNNFVNNFLLLFKLWVSQVNYETMYTVFHMRVTSLSRFSNMLIHFLNIVFTIYLNVHLPFNFNFLILLIFTNDGVIYMLVLMKK